MRALASNCLLHSASLIAIIGVMGLSSGCGDSETGPLDKVPGFTQAEYYPVALGQTWRYVLYDDESGAPFDTATVRIIQQTPDGSRQTITRCWFETAGDCVTEAVSPDSVVETCDHPPDRVSYRFPMRDGDDWVMREVLTIGTEADTLEYWHETATVTRLGTLTLRTGGSFADVLRIDESQVNLPHGGSPAETTLTASRYLARGVGIVCSRKYNGNALGTVSMELLGYSAGTGSTAQPAAEQFTAAALGTQIQLEWVNPPNAGFEGVLIRYARDGHPSRPEDGSPVPNGAEGRFPGTPAAAGSFLMSGLDTHTTYYFSAFAYDHALEYSVPACASVTTGTLPPPPPPDFLPRTSPENLLRNLIAAYRLRNVAEYESLLARPSFTFVLSPEDQQKPGMPDQWGRDTEVSIHQHMFGAGLVQTLTVGFNIGDVVWNPADEMYTVFVSHVNLYLYGATPGHPTEVKEYRVSDSRSKFWFRKNGWFWPGTQDSTCVIVRWEDDPAGSRAPPGVSE
jgi:hypothetical protein